ncbi:hypothetical protein GBF38_021973 [Nibea albiflora]|uniref:Uncharacterized protein n=1 Tax=Nibea albiflora TaxID=240163 RepID=A0ACB7FH03_NIBAL|nr:hypothetical protein GBF38_021973 [Nibea albiflora]
MAASRQPLLIAAIIINETTHTGHAVSHEEKSIDEKSSVAVISIFDVFRRRTHISANFSVLESLQVTQWETRRER